MRESEEGEGGGCSGGGGLKGAEIKGSERVFRYN